MCRYGSFGFTHSHRSLRASPNTADSGAGAGRRYHPPRMTPLLVIAAGLTMLAAGVGVLRSFGPRYRVGRLLAVTPKVSVGEAVAMAREGAQRYVRVDGRIDAEQDFPDEHHRPLVYRRRRVQLRRGSGWETFDESLERVPFEVHEGLDALAVDTDALGDGLVVLPRDADGLAEEVPDRVPPGTPPRTPVRLRYEQLSAVEHATVLGQPVARTDGTVSMTAGRGRPLVVTTLEIPEAMRVLGGGRDSARPLAAAICLAAGLMLLSAGLGWAVIEALT